MRLDDGILRLNVCEECHGTGDMFEMGPFEDNFIGGIPLACPACRGRRYVSYDEMIAWREKKEKEWNESGFGKFFKSKEFQDHLAEEIEKHCTPEFWESQC